MEYEYIDHTADVGVKAYGSDLRQVFANAALGLVDFMVETIDDPGRGGKTFEINLTAEDQEQLLVDWLNEVIFIMETESVVLNEFDVLVLEEKTFKANVSGHTYNEKNHRYKTEVKSATYHMLEIGRENDKYFGKILLDI